MLYSDKEEKGYSWFFFHPSNQWKVSLLVSSLILAISVGFFVWCTRVSDDMGGDSFAGLVFAIASTIFMFLAFVAFSLRRRARKRAIGELNAVLNWHVCFGVIALVMVFLHAFGNYNPRTGTYALYGMIALVISGFVGRLLDRMLPRFIAQDMLNTLTAQGEDRIESISRKLQSVEGHHKQVPRVFQSLESGASGSSASSRSAASELENLWNMDMGYVSLQQPSRTLNRSGRQQRFVPDRESSLTNSVALYPSAQDDLRAIEQEQQALKRQTFYRSVIRYWRLFHVCLAVLTVGLTLWHIEYALSLVIPALGKYGFGYLLPWP